MAEIIRYVDPDATGSGDGTSWLNAYTSLSAWNIGEATDLVSSGDTHKVFFRSSNGTADSTRNTSMVMWTTDSTHFVTLEAADSDKASKEGFDLSKYRLFSNISSSFIPAAYTVIKGLQFINNTFNPSGVINLSAVGILIDSIRMQNAGASSAIMSTSASVIAKIQNSIIVHDGISTGGSEGIYSQTCDTIDCYNNVVYGFDDGIERDGGIMNAINNASFNNVSQDFDGVFNTITNNASDDGSGLNAIAPLGGNWSNEFVDPINGDFTILNKGNLFDSGLGVTIDIKVPPFDIDGDLRSGSVCDIGADEFHGGGTIFNVTCNDSILPNDNINTQSIISALLQDGVSATDLTPSKVIFNPSLTDTTQLTDAITALTNISATLVELALLIDLSTTISAPIELVCNDTIELTDFSNGQLNFNVTCPEGISLTDFSNAVAIIAGSSLDGIQLTDIAIETSFLPQGRVVITGKSGKLKVNFNVILKPIITGESS